MGKTKKREVTENEFVNAAGCFYRKIAELRVDLAEVKDILKDRTKEEIHALIEKYGDLQYKTSEFALYDVILVAQQLQTQLTTMEIDITGTYNRGYIDGHKDAPKPNPDICQVCGANIKGMEHSCR